MTNYDDRTFPGDETTEENRDFPNDETTDFENENRDFPNEDLTEFDLEETSETVEVLAPLLAEIKSVAYFNALTDWFLIGVVASLAAWIAFKRG